MHQSPHPAFSAFYLNCQSHKLSSDSLKRRLFSVLHKTSTHLSRGAMWAQAYMADSLRPWVPTQTLWQEAIRSCPSDFPSPPLVDPTYLDRLQRAGLIHAYSDQAAGRLRLAHSLPADLALGYVGAEDGWRILGVTATGFPEVYAPMIPAFAAEIGS